MVANSELTIINPALIQQRNAPFFLPFWNYEVFFDDSTSPLSQSGSLDLGCWVGLPTPALIGRKCSWCVGFFDEYAHPKGLLATGQFTTAGYTFFPTCQVRVVRFYVSLLLLFFFLSSFVFLNRASPCAHCSPPDLYGDTHLNRSVPCPTSTARPFVFPAGPQPRTSAASVPCRTSTANLPGQCSLPGLNRQTKRMSQHMSERMSEDMPESMPGRMWEDLPERMPEDVSERMSDRISGDMPESMLEDMSERMSDRTSGDMPELMSERMSEDMFGKNVGRNVRKNVTRYVRKNVWQDFRRYAGINEKLLEDMSGRMSKDMFSKNAGGNVRKNVTRYVRKTVSKYVRKNVRRYASKNASTCEVHGQSAGKKVYGAGAVCWPWKWHCGMMLWEPWLCLWLMPLSTWMSLSRHRIWRLAWWRRSFACALNLVWTKRAQACIMMFLTSVHRSQRMELAELSKRLRQIVLWHAWHCACLLSEHPDEWAWPTTSCQFMLLTRHIRWAQRICCVKCYLLKYITIVMSTWLF